MVYMVYIENITRIKAMEKFSAGDKVTKSGYEGTVIREYMPGMYEVRLGAGMVVVPGSELKPATQVKDYTLTASNGRKIRTATKVTFANGSEVKFTERLSMREAIRQMLSDWSAATPEQREEAMKLAAKRAS